MSTKSSSTKQREYVLTETNFYPERNTKSDPFDDSEEELEIDDVEQQRQQSQSLTKPLDTAATAPKSPPPPLNERSKVELFAITFGAVFLSINAGFINGVSFHMAQTSVTHVTGSLSRSALALGLGNMEEFCVFTAIIMSFIFGSLITGRFMPHSSFHLGLEYGPLFLIGSLLLVLACIVSFLAPETNAYFYFAAMASGLQNSMTTKYSSNILRTTHMTGTATDIGLILGRMSVGDDRERWKLHILVPMFVGFFFGGVLSVPAWYVMGRYSLILNAIVFFLIGLAYSIVIAGEFHISVWKAFVGYYEISEKKYEKVQATVKKSLALNKKNHHRRHKKGHQSGSLYRTPKLFAGKGKNNGNNNKKGLQHAADEDSDNSGGDASDMDDQL